MPKYHKLPDVVDAVPYAPGVEDGYGHMTRDGQLSITFDGMGRLVDPGPAGDDRQRVPVILTPGGYHVVGDQDMVSTDILMQRRVVRKNLFERVYKPAD